MKIRFIISVIFAAFFIYGCYDNPNKKVVTTPDAAYANITTDAQSAVETITTSKDYKDDYKKLLENNTACNIDEDCISVPKGCCLCDGRAAVRRSVKKELGELQIKACYRAICTMQMCYMDINVACRDKKCVGALIPNQGIKQSVK
ncbi:MAG: hypothetical protein LBM71_05770 [Elusimicrobiota bacterium]|nr:hypothetical protein [Elusimicrobiota bacterium]